MSNTSYKQIIPATDWYFRHDNVSGVAGKSTVYWICPYISRHLLSLNPLQARCRRYSRGER